MFSKYTCRLLLTTSLAVLSAPAVLAQETDEADSGRQETIIIRGEFIPDPQRETSQVATFLSADDLARTGDANAAAALTRLSGLSIVSDKFAFVRGLGDRYSASTLNGSPLPSPEPLRRTVPLDLFPSNVLDGASVEKTFDVSAPGEFGGGLINLRTISRPVEDFTTVKFGISGDTVTTAEKGYFVSGSDSDWTGYDDGLRDIPSALQNVLNSDRRLQEFSDEEIEAVGESLVNSPLSVIQNGKLGPNFEGSVSLGRNFDVGSLGIGFIGVAGYDQEWTNKDITRQFVQGGVLGSEINTLETSLDVTTNALGSLTFDWDLSQVAATLFYVHSTTKEAQIDSGSDFNAPGTGNILDESTGWYERELAFFQLAGEHELGDFQFNWRGSLSETTRDAPYERSVRRLLGDDDVPRYSLANANSIKFSYLKDELASFGSDLIYTVEFDGDRELQLSGGFDVASTDRNYELYSFRFAGGNSLPTDVEEARNDFLFSPDNINNARFELQELPSVTDSYAASLDVNAAYVKAEVDLTSYLQATMGIRYEEAEQKVSTFDRFDNPGTGDVNLENEYLLPSALINWNFADDLQLRVGYSKTIARPQFRELARASYTDPDTDRVYRGSDGLIDSELTNYDVRLEYYFGRNQFVSLAGFYKEIENPIEEVQFSTSTFVFETTFLNSPKAELFGGEAEYRTKFDMPFSSSWAADRSLMFSANYTYTNAEVKADASDTLFDPISRTIVAASNFDLDGAVLQGTPEHILNTQFGWESDREQLTLLVGWVDERILQRGLDTPGAVVPDIIEEPGVQVDLVYKRDLIIAGRDFSFSLSGRNLLDTEHKEFQISEGDIGETDFYTYDRGRSLSASITAKF